MTWMDLILGVTSFEQYEWKDTTSVEWDLNTHGKYMTSCMRVILL